MEQKCVSLIFCLKKQQQMVAVNSLVYFLPDTFYAHRNKGVCMCVYVCVFKYVYVCVYIYIIIQLYVQVYLQSIMLVVLNFCMTLYVLKKSVKAWILFVPPQIHTHTLTEFFTVSGVSRIPRQHSVTTSSCSLQNQGNLGNSNTL